ncbi:hypothetical protein V492_04735 [Pseudogymnoascus sp. VKM F-4246]|nr:hypothetical protein V492_04735 [Pseudogymnoascus sp. VKM F-4246]
MNLLDAMLCVGGVAFQEKEAASTYIATLDNDLDDFGKKVLMLTQEKEAAVELDILVDVLPSSVSRRP